METSKLQSRCPQKWGCWDLSDPINRARRPRARNQIENLRRIEARQPHPWHKQQGVILPGAASRFLEPCKTQHIRTDSKADSSPNPVMCTEPARYPAAPVRLNKGNFTHEGRRCWKHSKPATQKLSAPLQTGLARHDTACSPISACPGEPGRFPWSTGWYNRL